MYHMRKTLDIILILGFLFVDLLLFHDILKEWQTYTVVDYLIGVLSIPVIIMSLQSLFKK